MSFYSKLDFLAPFHCRYLIENGITTYPKAPSYLVELYGPRFLYFGPGTFNRPDSLCAYLELFLPARQDLKELLSV